MVIDGPKIYTHTHTPSIPQGSYRFWASWHAMLESWGLYGQRAQGRERLIANMYSGHDQWSSSQTVRYSLWYSLSQLLVTWANYRQVAQRIRSASWHHRLVHFTSFRLAENAYITNLSNQIFLTIINSVKWLHSSRRERLSTLHFTSRNQSHIYSGWTHAQTL